MQPQMIGDINNEYIVISDHDMDHTQMIGLCKRYAGKLLCAFYSEKLGSMIISAGRSHNGRVITTAKPVVG